MEENILTMSMIGSFESRFGVGHLTVHCITEILAHVS